MFGFVYRWFGPHDPVRIDLYQWVKALTRRTIEGVDRNKWRDKYRVNRQQQKALAIKIKRKRMKPKHGRKRNWK